MDASSCGYSVAFALPCSSSLAIHWLTTAGGLACPADIFVKIVLVQLVQTHCQLRWNDVEKKNESI